MSRGPWRRPARIKVGPTWEPAPGFIERDFGVWLPEDYQPTPYERSTPVVKTAEDAVREYYRCAESLPYFATTHCWTVHVDDPSGLSPWRKVPAYPFTLRFFSTVQVPENTHIEKSRQMLMSWNWMVVFLWDIQFHARWSNLVISRRATEVDDGGERSTNASLLGKLRQIWTALPPYLQQPLNFQSGIVRHDDLQSVVHGETGTAKAGRGSTARRALVDECAYIEKSETVFKSVYQVAKQGTILQSTPNGKGNAFARIRFSNTTTFVKLRFHWTEHPEKSEGLYCTCGWVSDDTKNEPRHVQFAVHECGNLKKPKPEPPEARSPWYDEQKKNYTPEQLTSELDISYEKSTRGKVFDVFDATRHEVDHVYVVGVKGGRESEDSYRRRYLRKMLVPNKPCVVGWDFGVADPTSLVFGQELDPSLMHIRWLDEFELNGKDWKFYKEFILGLWAPIAREVTGYDLMHYGDPTAKGRDSNLESWIANLRSDVDETKKIVIITGPHVGGVLEWLDFIRNSIILRGHFEITTYCDHTIDALQNYSFPIDKETGELIPGRQLPVHDQWSHAMSALRYVYQFRYHSRLMNVEQTQVSATELLAMGDDVDKERPPMF